MDLLNKNLAQSDVAGKLLEDTKAIMEWLGNDRLSSICQEYIEAGLVPGETKYVTIKPTVDTRMNTLDIHWRSVRAQKSVVSILTSLPKYKEFYSSRSAEGKKKQDDMLLRSRFALWPRLDIMTCITGVLSTAQHLSSREDTPLSAWVLIVQATKNALESQLHSDDGMVDQILGPGSSKEMDEIFQPRFNMDGKPPAGRIVGLLDDYHIWCLLCDPHSHEWRSSFKIEGVIRVHVKNMIEFFVPINDDGSTKERDEVEREYQVSTST